MLFKKIDFSDPAAKAKFNLDPTCHLATWKHYYDSYNYALEVILEKGLSRNYVMNSKSRPVLFLLRHSLELCLKINLEVRNLPLPPSHVLKDLTDAYQDASVIPEVFFCANCFPGFWRRRFRL
jgi:hypothetical protein